MLTHDVKRNDRIVVTRLRTLQTHTRVSIKKKKKTEPPMCIQCNRILSTNHLLFERSKITSPAVLNVAETHGKYLELSEGN